MTRILTTEWAWSQVEAMADGSLRGEDRKRMRRMMQNDPRLDAAVDRARTVHAGLRQRRGVRVPRDLRRRLFAIAPRPAQGLRWAAVPLAAAALIGVLTIPPLIRPSVPTVDTRSAEAMQEFQTAMSYLSRSAAVTSHGVTRELSQGLSEALSAGRRALTDEKTDSETGG
jgi:hypothetical protein